MAKKRLRTTKDYREAWESIRDSAKEIAETALTPGMVNPAEDLAALADKEVRRLRKIEDEKVGSE